MATVKIMNGDRSITDKQTEDISRFMNGEHEIDRVEKIKIQNRNDLLNGEKQNGFAEDSDEYDGMIQEKKLIHHEEDRIKNEIIEKNGVQNLDLINGIDSDIILEQVTDLKQEEELGFLKPETPEQITEILNEKIETPIENLDFFYEHDGLRRRHVKHNSPNKLPINDGKWEARSDLLHWRDMPRHLQFNPYIFTGYRPLLSIWGCIHSLFYIHNETINIITHGKHL